MSIQETHLLAIADAIREKEGSTGAIAAEDFAARILALQDSASGYSMPLRLETNPGASVTAQNGEDILTGTADEIGNLTFLLPKPGAWTVTAALDGREKAKDLTVEDYALNFVSRLPEGYQEVEYIHTTATPIGFDTGQKFDFANTGIVMDFEADAYSGTGYILIAPVSAAPWLYIYRSSNTQIQKRIANASTQTATKVSMTGIRLLISYQDGAFKIGETIIATTTSTSITSKNVNLFSAGGNCINGKLYSAQMYNMRKLIRDWVPCVDPDGVVGLYDLVEKKFYRNAFAGTITAGPAV